MIIFDNNKNRKIINSAKGIKPYGTFLIYKTTYLNEQVVLYRDNGLNR